MKFKFEISYEVYLSETARVKFICTISNVGWNLIRKWSEITTKTIIRQFYKSKNYWYQKNYYNKSVVIQFRWSYSIILYMRTFAKFNKL